MKEQNKTPEKELNEKEINNISDAEVKTLVLRMLRELIECGHSIREEMKVTLSEIKKNLQGTNSEGDEAKNQTNDLEQKEEINMQQEQNEESKTNEERILNLWVSLTRSNIRIIGVPEGEEEEQELENIMKENFRNLAKEIDF